MLILLGQVRLAALDRRLPYMVTTVDRCLPCKVTTIDRFHFNTRTVLINAIS